MQQTGPELNGRASWPELDFARFVESAQDVGGKYGHEPLMGAPGNLNRRRTVSKLLLGGANGATCKDDRHQWCCKGPVPWGPIFRAASFDGGQTSTSICPSLGARPPKNCS